MTSKEIEELAGHRPVSAWVIKLVNDAIAIEREDIIRLCNDAHDLKISINNLIETIKQK